MLYELECTFRSQSDKRAFITVLRGEIPYRPDVGDLIIPYEFDKQLVVTETAWDCSRKLLMIDAVGDSDLNVLEDAFKKTHTVYKEEQQQHTS